MANSATEIRRFVENRAHGCCEYCLSQQQFATHRFSVDHIIPPKSGGSNEPENLALCCQGCNNFKFQRTRFPDPQTGEEVPLFHPRDDRRADHFQWNENFTALFGLSPTGRATIEALRLNRECLLKQRAIYRAFGVHPPDFQ